MVERVKPKEGAPPNRLESWLDRKIQAGALKALPRYIPLRGRDGECPEQYARALLTGLRAPGADQQGLERIKGDGRAFRSWAESVLAHAPRGGDVRGGCYARGYAV
jgi:hypothetical protein